MPPVPSKERRKGGLLVPIALGGAVVAGVVGWLWWRRSRAKGGGPGAGPVLVASTAPGQPEIS